MIFMHTFTNNFIVELLPQTPYIYGLCLIINIMYILKPSINGGFSRFYKTFESIESKGIQPYIDNNPYFIDVLGANHSFNPLLLRIRQ
jgi:hypothetical protein